MPEPNCKIAIVILNWNTKQYLEQLLPVMIRYSGIPGIEIHIADNASGDGSLEMVKEKFPAIHMLALGKNYGFAGGYNKALQQIDATYYVLVNSDVEVTPGWLEPLISVMDAEADIAACMPKIRWWHQREKFEYAGAAGGYLDYLGYPFCRGRIFDALETDHGQYDDERKIFWATGACMMVRSDCFHALGGFDETFFAHQEEIDLCWRMQRAGFSIAYCPSSMVFHMGGGTLPKTNPWKTFLNFRNNLLLLYKNLPPDKLFGTLFKRMILDGISALRFLAGFDWADGWAVFHAHMSFYGLIGKYRKYRKGQKYPQSLNQLTGMIHKSIVLEFFLRKKKTFEEIVQ